MARNVTFWDSRIILIFYVKEIQTHFDKKLFNSSITKGTSRVSSSEQGELTERPHWEERKLCGSQSARPCQLQ
jgi:hypothetical protein